MYEGGSQQRSSTTHLTQFCCNFYRPSRVDLFHLAAAQCTVHRLLRCTARPPSRLRTCVNLAHPD